MTDKFSFFGERVRVSAELAERIKQRWNVVHYATENEHQAEVIDHGPNFMRPEQVAAPAPVERPINAAQIGSDVVSLDAYRDRQQYQADSEELQRQRLATDARRLEEEARREFAA